MTSRAQPVNSSHPETPGSEAELHREEVALLNEEVNRLQAQLAKFTDDRCYGRCDSPQGLRDWFSYETRGLLTPDEAHEVLDMVLNRIHGVPR